MRPEDSRERWRLMRPMSARLGLLMRARLLGRVVTVHPVPAEQVCPDIPAGYWIGADDGTMVTRGNFETPELAELFLARYGIVPGRAVTRKPMTGPGRP